MTTTAEWIDAIASFVQALAIAVAGGWALYIYRRGRRGHAVLGIETGFRFLPRWTEENALLLVSLRITNTSSALYWHREATITLMDARRATSKSGARLVPFSKADPLPPVYGDLNETPDAIDQGDLFDMKKSQITIEPGETIRSEIAFVLNPDKVGLMGCRVRLQGQRFKERFRRWPGKPLYDKLVQRSYWYGTFSFVAPTELVTSEETS